MKVTKMNKKGIISLNEVPGVVILLITVAIFLAVGAIILDEMNDNALFTDGSAAMNATTEGLSGLNTLGSFQTIIAVVIAAAVILGIVFLIRT